MIEKVRVTAMGELHYRVLNWRASSGAKDATQVRWNLRPFVALVSERKGTGEKEMANALEVVPNKNKLLFTMILGTVIVGLCLWGTWASMTTQRLADAPLGARLMPAAICLMIGLIMSKPALLSFKRFRRQDPEIAVNDEGIYAWMWADDLIPWTNITQVTEHIVPGAKMLSVSMVDPSLNPPRKKSNWFVDKNRDFLNAVTAKTQSAPTKAAVIALSPAAFASMAMANKMPDHRSPVLHTANTDTKHEVLRDFIANMIARKS
jgi:uncharacterized membrane protein YhaH (DUF805 family)